MRREYYNVAYPGARISPGTGSRDHPHFTIALLQSSYSRAALTSRPDTMWL